MEESKLRTHRRPPVGSGRPVRRGAGSGPAASSHVIDLRAAKPDAASTPAKPPATKGRRTPKPPRRPLAAPNQSAAPVKQTPPVASARPPAAPMDAIPAISPASSELALPPRRFWPAFWRFLVLLVILALLVVGGVYLYINYYRG